MQEFQSQTSVRLGGGGGPSLWTLPPGSATVLLEKTGHE